MKIGSLVLQLRNSQTEFEIVGGAAEYAFARESTLTKEAAFVLPLQDSANSNDYDTIINQTIIEQFAVVVAIKNDTNFQDKTGFAAYNRIHQIRQQIFGAYLGLDIGRVYGKDEGYTTESLVYYVGGQLLDLDRAYLWFQFTFAYKVGIEAETSEEADGFLDRIFAQYELEESDNIPFAEPGLPAVLFAPDMEQMVDLSEIRAALEVTPEQALDLIRGDQLTLLDGTPLTLVGDD
jgi:hypothetical protein